MDANIPVCFSVKTSAEWAASGLTILRGQPAFEVGDSDGKLLYILVGDGNPANVNPPGEGANPAYRRLRAASATDVQKNLDEKYTEITASVAAARSEARNALDAHAGLSEEAHGIPGQIDAKIAAFDVPGQIGAAVDAHASLTEEAHEIPVQIDGKIATHDEDPEAHGDIREGLHEIPVQTDAKIATHDEDPEAHEDIRGELGGKAPVENPVFGGTVDMRGAVVKAAQPRENAEGPYSDPDQPSTVRDFLEISGLTIESAGEYLREFDSDGRLSQFDCLKILDRAAGKYFDEDSGRWVMLTEDEYAEHAEDGTLVTFTDEYSDVDRILFDRAEYATRQDRYIQLKATEDECV